MTTRDRITFDTTPEIRALLEKLRKLAEKRLGGERVSDAQAIRSAIKADAKRKGLAA